MWLVLTAMRRPITIVVMVLGVILSAFLAIQKMPIDIFPRLGLPVVYVAQPYGGLSPEQMEGFVSSYYEYHFLYITGIKQIESKNIQGISLIRLEFHPGTNMGQAVAEVVAQVNRARSFMPPGTIPPFVVRFDAGSVPVGQLVFSSETRSLSEIQDLALFKVRPMFASLPGVSAPPPFGGNQRTVVIHVDPSKLRSYGLSPDDVVKAVSTGNVIVPSGNVRVGGTNYLVPSNAVVQDIQDLNSLPIRTGAGPAVYLSDVGRVENSADILSGYALVNGKRTVFINVAKRADASTWSVVQSVKKALPAMREAIPPDIKVNYEFDQSVYVKNALTGLGFEALLGALLTGLMVLLFLKNWRSALIVVITIPISLLFAVMGLWLAGQTINIMTLGGLALAIGILVDEATVTMENIHSHLAQGKPKAQAILDSGREIAFPKLLILICVLTVFIPSFFMMGIPRALFVPLSLSVGFAMIASYLLSQTLVPVVATWLSSSQEHPTIEEKPPGSLTFYAIRERYMRFLSGMMNNKKSVITLYGIVTLFLLILINGRLHTELFPSANTGMFKLRLRAPVGTRVEQTEQITLKALDIINNAVGSQNIETTLAFVGTQPSSYPVNSIHLWTSGPQEAVISVALKRHVPVNIGPLKEQLRHEFATALPETAISFEPGDLVGKVTNLGAPTPIEIAIAGKGLNEARAFADKINAALAQLPYIRDLQYGQPVGYPTINVQINRLKAGQLGLTVEQIGRALVAATSSSRFTQPNYWLDNKTGTAYQVQVEIPQNRLRSIGDLARIPIASDPSGPSVEDVSQLIYGRTVAEYDRLNNQRMVTLTANIAGNDLGRAAKDITRMLKKLGKPPQGIKVIVRGQVQLMMDTMSELQNGLLIAIVAIFLILAANFQSFSLSGVVLTSVPAVLLGVEAMLWLTGTSLNIQSYLGAIMSTGVAVANSILLVTYAETARKECGSALEAAIEAAFHRFRPIVMTSIAMIIGMLPMALALTEGGEQTAPLGRAVIGGLIASTFVTLIVIPLVFAIVQNNKPLHSASLDPTDPESAYFQPSLNNS